MQHASVPGAPDSAPAESQGLGTYASATGSCDGSQLSGAPSASADPNTGIIAIMNIGAGDEASFSGKKQERFRQKLDDDIKWMIANNADIIMLQEVSEYWADHLRGKLPADWTLWRPGAANVATLHNSKKVTRVSEKVEFVWPQNDRNNQFRRWRQFTMVLFRRGCGPPPSPWPSPVPASFLDLARFRAPHGRWCLGAGVGNG